MVRSKKLRDLDVQIGRRVRLARSLANMSQTELGKALGISFQQIQKYESGYNRVSSSSLWNISKLLDQPLLFFFPSPDELQDYDPLEPLTELNNLKATDALNVLRSLDKTTVEQRRLMIDLISTL
jgi:transcriptional regulator with XRE-family HTH domain